MTSPSRMAFTCLSSTHTTLSIFCLISFTFKIEKVILSLRASGLCLGRIHLEFTWSFHTLPLYLLIHSLMHKSFPQTAPIVWTQFVVQTNSALAQWVQDNKFVESGLENWVLVDSGSYHHKFRDNFNETTETNGKIFSIRGAFFWCSSLPFFFFLHLFL